MIGIDITGRDNIAKRRKRCTNIKPTRAQTNYTEA
jgi:hypothetical protein